MFGSVPGSGAGFGVPVETILVSNSRERDVKGGADIEDCCGEAVTTNTRAACAPQN
jgi:hypothetical protein